MTTRSDRVLAASRASGRRRDGRQADQYRLPEAHAVVEAVRAGRPIPPTPKY